MSITFYIEGQPEDTEALEVNVSNVNGAMLLERLGIEFDYCGSVEAEVMLGASLLALAINTGDDGMADTIDVGAGGATIIDCGLRAGYWADRLSSVADLATEAKELNRKVVWA